MTFTAGIPKTGQTLGGSRQQVQDNFTSLRTTISQGLGVPGVGQPNHIDVNQTGAGKHIFVQMPVQTTSASNLPALGEGGLITRTFGTPVTASELFYARDAVATYYQMTGPVQVGASGYTMLFGGIIMQWATATSTPVGTVNAFPKVFPNNIFSITLGAKTFNGTVISAANVTNFTLTGNGGTYYYIAIGN